MTTTQKTPIRVIKAKKIITMNPNMPEATHVAIRDGRVLSVGDEPRMQFYGKYELDERFADDILMPGMVEGHAHALEGGVWDFTYVGYQSRYDPDGNLWAGAQSLDDVVAVLSRIEQHMADPAEPLFAWGFDPIYFGDQRISVKDIDRVSSTRPILILHSNGHLMNTNSRGLAMAGITRDTDVHGILKDAEGNPTGELMEMAAQYMLYKQVGNPFFGSMNKRILERYAQAAVNSGVTTATDLFADFSPETLQVFSETTTQADYPLRLVPALNTLSAPFEDGIATLKQARDTGNDKLHYGLCKVMTDGSIQGFTARVRWPGYFNGAKNGLWNMPPGKLTELVIAYHKAGLHLHMHTNGDEAIQLMLDAVETAQALAPRNDHRHTLQHCQMADEAQFRKMAELGVCANLFANHIYYWGDQHAAYTMGPDRASRMNACRTALNHGVPLAIHSDAPVSPLGPLFTAWCAVNRLTASGKLLGEHQRISVEEALYTITQGAAFTLKLDHCVGSIDIGKYADFAVLKDDPQHIDAMQLKDVGIKGTILGGTFNQAKEKKAV